MTVVLSAHGQNVQSSNTAVYGRGITLFQNGLYQKSADELEQFIEQHADHSLVESARFYRARALSQTDPQHASAYLQQFIEAYPNTVFAQKLLLERANRQKQAGNYDQALKYYSQVLDLSISNSQAAKVYYWMAQVEAERENYVQARSYYLTLADNYPKSKYAPKALYARGRLFLEQGKYKAAADGFEILEDRYPNDPMTRQIGTALGEAYYRQKKYKQAITSLKKGLPYLEGDAKEKAIYLTSESYNALNNFDKASSNYLQYINLTKGTDKERPAHYGLGWVYNKQKIYHWAADEFGKAAAGTDTLARKALYYKAVNEKLGGRYQKSLSTFEKFGKRYSGGLWFEQGYYEWAITAYEMGDYGEAIEALLPLVRADVKLKQPGKVYTLLGQAYFANNEYTRALRAFDAAEKLANIDPKVKRKARFQKAWVQFRNQAYAPARKIFADIYRQASDSEIGRKALFWEADSYYNLQQFDSAGRLFADFIQRYPNNKLTGAARYSLGWSYFKKGAYSKAIQPFQQFLNNYDPPKVALFPYDTDTRLRLGDSYYALSDYNKAIQIYQQSVNDDPGGDYALFQIGNSYYRSERTYEAVKTFRQFMQQFPKSGLREQAQYNIAYIYLNTQNYQQAIKEFETAINKYPNTQWAARSQYNIGDAYYNNGQYDKAIAAYKKVMNDYPNSDYIIEATNGIEYARKAKNGGTPPDTTSALDNYINNNSQSSQTNDRLRYQQAESLVQAGDYIKAIQKLKQYIRISNNDELLPKAYVNLGRSYERTSHPAQAAQSYQSVVDDYASSDQMPMALAALGRLKYAQRNYQQSLDYYQRLGKLGSNHQAEAHVGMGNAQLAMNKSDAAAAEYKSALQVGGANDAAHVGMARIATRSGNSAAAIEALSTVAKNNTSETGAEAQYLLGLTRQKQGQYKKALDDYSKVKVLYQTFDEWMAKSMLESGRSYIKMSNESQARRELQLLIKKYPQRPEAAKAQQLIQSMQ